MKRWATLFFVLLAACSMRKETDVTNDPAYKAAIGGEWKTVVDLAVFKKDATAKELSVNIPGSPGIPKVLPMTFPYDEGGLYIVGILPRGSSFKITKAIRIESSENSYIQFRAVVESPDSFKGTEINPTWLAEGAYYPNVPKFDEKYVVPAK